MTGPETTEVLIARCQECDWEIEYAGYSQFCDAIHAHIVELCHHVVLYGEWAGE